MLRSHRRRSSAFGSTNGTAEPAGKPRADAAASTAPESMDVVHDQEGGPVEAEAEAHSPESRRYPTKLRGRGGFGHARVSNGRGFKTSAATSPSKPAPATMDSDLDPMETLAAGMSALQFVPSSVRIAQGRGRGRGG